MTAITYTATGEGRRDIHAEFTTAPADPDAALAILDAAALALMPEMRLDSMEAKGNAYRTSEAYRRFNALSWLADRTFPGECAYHWQCRWKELDAAKAGTEPEPGRMGRFEIEWSQFKIQIDYEPNSFGLGHDHIEVRKLAPAGFDLPITDTGYRSIFTDRFDIKHAGGVGALVVAMLDAANTPACQQGSLF
jgi:hypothetical protein